MSAPRSRGPVKVVQFNEESYQGGSSSKSKERSITPRDHEIEMKRKRREAQQSSKQVWEDVMALGRTGLHKRDRKKAEEERLVQLGCKPAKRPKVPLKVLFSMHKTHAKRDAKREAEEKAAELITGRPKVHRSSKSKERTRKRFDEVHKWNDGNFHKGILRLKKMD
mmetsp:Transcript_14430/g.25843  ORF Transcript_14430/g.25843 Transcript_14430/m.25843 type:complete len:166 (-) Transcript_14430:30-527(-)